MQVYHASRVRLVGRIRWNQQANNAEVWVGVLWSPGELARVVVLAQERER